MDMQMLGDARARSPTLIDADVDALGFDGQLHKIRSPIDKLPQGCPLLGVVVKQRGRGMPQSNEQMPTCVRIAIEQDESHVGAADDMVGCVVLRGVPIVEQERSRAGLRGASVLLFGFEGFEIVHPPGRKEGLMDRIGGWVGHAMILELPEKCSQRPTAWKTPAHPHIEGEALNIVIMPYIRK